MKVKKMNEFFNPVLITETLKSYEIETVVKKLENFFIKNGLNNKGDFFNDV